MSVDPAVISLSEAAAILGIDPSTAYRQADRGVFPVPVLKVGRLKKVSTRALHAFIDGPSPAPSGETVG